MTMFAQQHIEFENSPEILLWHRLADDCFPCRRTAMKAACGATFALVGDVLTADRTLLDWAETDDLCECAVVIPTEEQCKARGLRLFVGQGTDTAYGNGKVIEAAQKDHEPA